MLAKITFGTCLDFCQCVCHFDYFDTLKNIVIFITQIAKILDIRWKKEY